VLHGQLAELIVAARSWSFGVSIQQTS